MRRTKQRNAILGSIRSAEGPLSIAQIHERAGEEIPGLGIATVYRAVKALREGGEIVAVDLPGEEPHYEALVSRVLVVSAWRTLAPSFRSRMA